MQTLKAEELALSGGSDVADAMTICDYLGGRAYGVHLPGGGHYIRCSYGGGDFGMLVLYPDGGSNWVF